MKFFYVSEIKTYLFLVICKKLISMEIEVFFEQKEKAVYTFLPEIIKNKKAYSMVFNKYDLEKIYKTSEKIMLEMLLKRYKNLPIPVIQFVRTNNNRIDFFNLISIKERKIKKKTFIKISLLYSIIFLSKFMRFHNKQKKLNDILNNILINEELDRVSKALKTIKYKLKNNINSQIADTFAATQNLLIKSKNKNSVLKIANDEAQKSKVIEA